jgi:hypothetical protein
LLWTQADDSGILRGNSRMLASLLYPYDDDSKELFPLWLEELSIQHCVEVHEVEGDKYLKICNWLKHQKIDKPSKSKFPVLSEASRIFVEASRKIALDQGSRIKDQGMDQKSCARKTRTEQANPSEVSKSAAQTRHSRIQEMVMNAYQEQNQIQCPWNGAEGKQLKAFLDSTPRWTDQQIAQCLMNLYASEGFPKGTPPKEFLTYLPKYLQGPLNQFKQSGVANGNGKARDRQKADIDAILTASARMAGKHNGKSEGEVSRPADNSGNGPSVDGGLEGFDKAVRH